MQWSNAFDESQSRLTLQREVWEERNMLPYRMCAGTGEHRGTIRIFLSHSYRTRSLQKQCQLLFQPLWECTGLCAMRTSPVRASTSFSSRSTAASASFRCSSNSLHVLRCSERNLWSSVRRSSRCQTTKEMRHSGQITTKKVRTEFCAWAGSAKDRNETSVVEDAQNMLRGRTKSLTSSACTHTRYCSPWILDVHWRN